MAKKKIVITASELASSLSCEQRSVFDDQYGQKRTKEGAASIERGKRVHAQAHARAYAMGADTSMRPEKQDRRCMVATCVWGGDDARTQALRDWRDRTLMTRRIGRLAVRAYYGTSPAAVRLLERSPRATRAVQWLLGKFVARLGHAGETR